ncbi:MAG: peptidylprolyl isomerase [Coleofasciculaceae cyanobacterium]
MINNLDKLSIEADELVEYLKNNVQLKEVYEKILHQKIIAQAAQEKGITVTTEEIQEQADQMRFERRLEKASETLAWLADQIMTPDEWEAGIRDRLLTKKLANVLFAKEVEKFFAQNRLDFDQVLLYQIMVGDEKLAQELFYQLEEQEISFYEAAHIYDIDEKRREQCGFEGKIDRWTLAPEIAAIVFVAKLGEAIKPLKAEQGYRIFMVEKFIPAELTPERYQTILDNLFKEWLASELTYLLHS